MAGLVQADWQDAGSPIGASGKASQNEQHHKKLEVGWATTVKEHTGFRISVIQELKAEAAVGRDSTKLDSWGLEKNVWFLMVEHQMTQIHGSILPCVDFLDGWGGEMVWGMFSWRPIIVLLGAQASPTIYYHLSNRYLHGFINIRMSSSPEGLLFDLPGHRIRAPF